MDCTLAMDKILISLLFLTIGKATARPTCYNDTSNEARYYCVGGEVLAPGSFVSDRPELVYLIMNSVGEQTTTIRKADVRGALQFDPGNMYRYIFTCVPGSYMVRLCPDVNSQTVIDYNTPCGFLLSCKRPISCLNNGQCRGSMILGERKINLYAYENPSIRLAPTMEAGFGDLVRQSKQDFLRQVYYEVINTNQQMTPFIIGFQTFDYAAPLLSWIHYDSCWEAIDRASDTGSYCPLFAPTGTVAPPEFTTGEPTFIPPPFTRPVTPPVITSTIKKRPPTSEMRTSVVVTTPKAPPKRTPRPTRPNPSPIISRIFTPSNVATTPVVIIRVTGDEGIAPWVIGVGVAGGVVFSILIVVLLVLIKKCCCQPKGDDDNSSDNSGDSESGEGGIDNPDGSVNSEKDPSEKDDESNMEYPEY